MFIESDVETSTIEKNYNDLSAAEKKKIDDQMQKADASVKATTDFMHTSPTAFEGFSYSTTFEDGNVDNHGIDQYIFKLACAIVDKRWKEISH